jgi:prepilin-type N-terminal cleavage/methylation domain-containing protein
MPTSSSSPRTSSRFKAGFTLIELLISAAIITVISSIVLVKFSAFDSTVLLKSLAYEVGTTIREAQVYSVSVINVVGDTNFRYPYGVSFTPGNTTYTLYRFTSETSRPFNDIADPDPDIAEILRTYNLSGSIEISEICFKRPTASEDCTSGTGRLDISFKRPEFAAIFHPSWISLTDSQRDAIEYGKIKFRSTKNTADVWVVEVKALGQIIVYKQ